MCDWMLKAKDQLVRLGQMFIEDYFPQFVHILPPGKVTPGHCLSCNRPLQHHEMYPNGAPARYMCRTCYEKLAYNWPDNTCLTCRQPLDYHRISQRRSNPRELRYAMHDGPCEDYHSALAGIIFGLPINRRYTNFTPNQASIGYQHIPRLGYQQQQTIPDNLGFWENDDLVLEPVRQVPNRNIKYMKLPG